jgi:hypothetical protein
MRASAVRMGLAGALLVSANVVPATGADAQTFQSAPGFSWADLRYPGSPDELERRSFIGEAAAIQNFICCSLAERVDLLGFVSGRVLYGTRSLDWNNRMVLGAGAALRFRPTDHFEIRLGGRYEVDRRRITNRTLGGPAAFTSWGGWWPVGEGSWGAGVTSSHYIMTWGEARFPSSPVREERNNGLVEGAIEGGTRFPLGADFSAIPFLGFGYKADTEQLRFNNKFEFTAGARLAYDVTPTTSIFTGVRFAHEHRFIDGEGANAAIVFVGWNASWDLFSGGRR